MKTWTDDGKIVKSQKNNQIFDWVLIDLIL